MPSVQAGFPYVTRIRAVGGDLQAIPVWGRYLLILAAIPGLTLLLLSIAALAVSILALLLLTVPVYRLLLAVSGNRSVVIHGQSSDGAAFVATLSGDSVMDHAADVNANRIE